MSLQSSEYATMAIREITRMDTGIKHHSKLSREHVQSSYSTSVSIKRSIEEIDNNEPEKETKLLKTEEMV